MGSPTESPPSPLLAAPRNEGPRAEEAVRAFEMAGGDVYDPLVRAVVATLGAHAPALAPLTVADPTLPRDILARPLERGDTEDTLRRAYAEASRDLEDGPELSRSLRHVRHRVLVRIALREILRLADVDTTSREMAALAGAALDTAASAARRAAEARFGGAVDAAGRPVPFVVLGMGKLGGGELNLGSDIDVCFFYGTDEGRVGDRAEISVHELFARVASRTAKLLSEVTEHGFCFRVDLRLRPEGSRGPLVNSLVSAERYYESWGRTWERAALLRARPVAGDTDFGDELLTVLRPFVYRHSVDPGIATEMTQLVRRARRELSAHPDRDVKLGRGGIREAEFFVQTLQLIWGGRHAELRVHGTIQALERLRAAGFVTPREAEDLAASWALLRRVEHRIHMHAGYQTHELPSGGAQRDEFARSLGLASASELDEHLGKARTRVQDLFDSLVEARDEPEPAPDLERLADQVASGAQPDELVNVLLDVLPVHDPHEAASHLVRLGRRADMPLGAVGRERHPMLGPLLLRDVAEATDADRALRFLAEFYTRLRGAGAYDRLLSEHPLLRSRLIGLFGASATLSSALIGHPGSLDRLLVSGGDVDASTIVAAHGEAPITPAPGEGLPLIEDHVAALRRVKRELILELGLAYVGGDLDLEGVEDRMTALAEAQLLAALRYAERETERDRGRPRTAMVVVGMGKLGAGELGFGSDLDLIFVFGEDGDAEPAPGQSSVTNAELLTRIAQRTLRLLSQPDAEGPGWDTDARLRPSGSQGMLLTSFDGLRRYHETRAHGWERLALIRARSVAGDPELGTQVEALFAQILGQGGAPEPEEIAALRARIELELAGERKDRLHPKLGYGALVDVELMTQWLELRHGVRCRRTRDALRSLGAGRHLPPSTVEALLEAHTFFRRVVQAQRLAGETREPQVYSGGRVAEQVARALGLRERDGQRPTEVLLSTWKRHAEEVRSIFEQTVAGVGVPPPWGAQR